VLESGELAVKTDSAASGLFEAGLGVKIAFCRGGCVFATKGALRAARVELVGEEEIGQQAP
jgi:hypothetical protein